MKTIKTYLPAGSLFVSIAAIAIAFVIWLKQPKMAYVDLGKVYAEFALKKELQTKLEQVKQMRQSQIDSMKLDLNVLVKNLQSEKVENRKSLEEQFNTKRQQYALKNQAFTEETDRLTQAYDDQIWKQLNDYVKAYGKSHGYRYIFGAEGSGSLMYAEDVVNITDQVTAYVNDQYKGIAAK